MNTEPDEYLPTRESLLSRLRNWDDHKSWSEFFESYWKMIFRVARRAGLSEAESEDIVQDTIIAVARKLPAFQYDRSIGSFKAWLLTITRNRIHDLIRKKHYHRGGQQFRREEALSTSVLEAEADLNALNLDHLWDEEWRENLVEKATERVKLSVTPKQYQLFYFHVVKEIPAREVAERLNARLTAVYVAKYRVSKLLRKEIKALEASLS